MKKKPCEHGILPDQICPSCIDDFQASFHPSSQSYKGMSLREINMKINEENYTKKDIINHPSHYTQGNVEAIDAIEAALTPEEFRGYCKGNALKYIWREKHKGQNESLKKAIWYLERVVNQ
jgi:hypothetical protein